MDVDEELTFQILPVNGSAKDLDAVRHLLHACHLDTDQGIEVFVAARQGGRIIASAGVDRNVIKCVAILPEFRGERLSLQLVGEAVKLAADRGHFHQFLYTKPESVSFFRGCGFYPLVEVPGYVTVMENTPVGITRYCESLSVYRKPDRKTGCVVMNANPFTLGHCYLAEQAAASCDWLHLFVVREDLSLFAYDDRMELVRQGTAHIPNLTVHGGSCYMVSKATFPSYFLKEKEDVGTVFTAIDLLLFREYIGPALGITHRFVGTEPFCQVTEQYNEDMKYWLQDAPARKDPITVIEIERSHSLGGAQISASEVRRLLRQVDFERIRSLVPKSTWHFLKQKYGQKIALM